MKLRKSSEVTASTMNYATAHQLIEQQAQAAAPEDLLARLAQGQAPVPGQVTSILLALKVIYEALHGQASLDRQTVSLLHRLAGESRTLFEQGLRQGVDWPPLLDADLGRIAAAVQGIFTDAWPDIHQV